MHWALRGCAHCVRPASVECHCCRVLCICIRLGFFPPLRAVQCVAASTDIHRPTLGYICAYTAHKYSKHTHTHERRNEVNVRVDACVLLRVEAHRSSYLLSYHLPMFAVCVASCLFFICAAERWDSEKRLILYAYRHIHSIQHRASSETECNLWIMRHIKHCPDMWRCRWPYLWNGFRGDQRKNIAAAAGV